VRSTTVEAFAGITCRFTHVRLKRVVEHLAQIDHHLTARFDPGGLAQFFACIHS
jgi:hypothetical protein